MRYDRGESVTDYKPNDINVCSAILQNIKENYYYTLNSFQGWYNAIYHTQYFYDIDQFHVKTHLWLLAYNAYANEIFHALSYSFDYLFPCLKPRDKDGIEKFKFVGDIFKDGLKSMRCDKFISRDQYNFLLKLKDLRIKSTHQAELFFNEYLFNNQDLVFNIISMVFDLLCNDNRYDEDASYEHYDKIYDYEEQINNFFAQQYLDENEEKSPNLVGSYEYQNPYNYGSQILPLYNYQNAYLCYPPNFYASYPNFNSLSLE